MKSAKGNQMIESLIEKVKGEFDQSELVTQLKNLRAIAREEKDPALVKIIRLCYEYIEVNEDFDIGFMEEEGIEDMNDLEYLLELILRSE